MHTNTRPNQPHPTYYKQVLTGVAASALALPGLLKVKAALLGKLLWRVASYRFPVAMGAYVAAALAARFVVGRVQVRDRAGRVCLNIRGR